MPVPQDAACVQEVEPQASTARVPFLESMRLLAHRVAGALTGGPAAVVLARAEAPPAPAAVAEVPDVMVEEVPAGFVAIRPDGTPVAPDDFLGGYHGTTEVPPEIALARGLPERGTDLRLKEHSEGERGSAFRGTTSVVSDPVNENGAAWWAGSGGWVYEIRGVPSWDVNLQLGGRVQLADGTFRGNLMSGENERAIPARVPPEHIRRWGVVEETRTGKMIVREWHDNPGYQE